jgi:hypothetical protein
MENILINKIKIVDITIWLPELQLINKRAEKESKQKTKS